MCDSSVEYVSADGVNWRFMVLFILAPDLSSAVNVVKLSRQSHTSISIESSTWVKCMSAWCAAEHLSTSMI